MGHQPSDAHPPISRDSLGRLNPGTGVVFRGRSRKDPILKLIDQSCGRDAEELIKFLASVALGSVRAKERAPGPNEDALSYALVPESMPSFAERVNAAKILIQYRHGPARDVAPDTDALRPGYVAGPYDLSKLDDAALARIEADLQTAWAAHDVVNVTPEPADE